jgi:RNA polymerase sigma-70 factor (ECF subfamily)
MDYSQYSDELLLERIVQQDAGALAELYDRYAQIAYNMIVRIVRDVAVADEILQETFWQVWQKANEFSGRGAAAAWLYRIARNKSLDQLRRQKARPQPVETASEEEERALWDQLRSDDHAGVEDVIERRWDYRYLRQALSELPAEQRLCLELAYFEGMSQQRIAEYTNTPLGTVKTRLRIGLEKLERIFRSAGYQNSS